MSAKKDYDFIIPHGVQENTGYSRFTCERKMSGNLSDVIRNIEAYQPSGDIKIKVWWECKFEK